VTSIEPQQQLEFLSKIQRLLGEGQFTATYKYALLLAIADICVEDGEDSASPFEIYTWKIAEKFITYYWPQVRPYGAGKSAFSPTLFSLHRIVSSDKVRMANEAWIASCGELPRRELQQAKDRYDVQVRAEDRHLRRSRAHTRNSGRGAHDPGMLPADAQIWLHRSGGCPTVRRSQDVRGTWSDDRQFQDVS
jgi:hypothetical protein